MPFGRTRHTSRKPEDEVDRVAGGPADRMAVNLAFSDRMPDVSSAAGSQSHGM
jgi:hypothetical protein